MALTRLNKELRAMESDPSPYVTAGPINDDMFHWSGTIVGPANTPYQGGVFFLDIQLTANYPFSPPAVKFTTKIFHPNIHPNGDVCRGLLRDYGPYLTIDKFLLFIVSLLDAPNDGEPANPEAAYYYQKDPEKYNSIIREYTRKYAM